MALVVNKATICHGCVHALEYVLCGATETVRPTLPAVSAWSVSNTVNTRITTTGYDVIITSPIVTNISYYAASSASLLHTAEFNYSTCGTCNIKCTNSAINCVHLICLIPSLTNQLFASGGGGCCDCGDPEAWTSFVHCDIHKPSEQNEMDVSQSLILKVTCGCVVGLE